MTQVYEIKINRNWKKVRATSMRALSEFVDSNRSYQQNHLIRDFNDTNNEITDWRMVGMMSRSEMLESQSLEVVA